MVRSSLDVNQRPISARKTWQRILLTLGGIEVVALAITAYFLFSLGLYPTTTFWLLMLVAAAVVALAFEGVRTLLRVRKTRSYAHRFDMRDQIRRMSAQADELDPDLKTEEILEEFVDLGRRTMKEGKNEEALEHFRRALELDPQQSRLYNFQGLALGRLGRMEEAVESYSRAIAIDYDYSKAHFNLALAYEKLEQSSDALEEWIRYVDVGEVIGERQDKLDFARECIRRLKEGQQA